MQKDNIISDHWILKRKHAENSSPHPHAFVTKHSGKNIPQSYSKPHDSKIPNTNTFCMEDYEPFLFQGSIYINDPDYAKPVEIL